MTHPCWNRGATAEPSLYRPPAPEATHSHTHLRTGNDAPLDSEIPLIREIISDGEGRLAMLETQIRGLEATLVKLMQRRDEAADHLREHRAILHPHRRAPPQLICEIFAMALDTPNDSTYVQGSGYESPWYLGHICQSWRLWALAYPRLWSHIAIPSCPADALDRAALETLLLRSSNALLDVCCWAIGGHEHFVDHTLADLAVLHCKRWATLRIDLRKCPNSHTLNLSWLNPLKGCLPALKSLDVSFPRSRVDDFPDVFSVAPSLSRLLLTNWKLERSPPTMHFPWDQITHYRGAFPEVTQLEVLQAAPQLVQCAVSFNTSVPPAPETSSPIALSHLRRLCIDEPTFLLHLTAPSLEELNCLYMGREDIPALLPFVRRSHCLLRKLVLVSCCILPTLFDALRSLSSLTYLLIDAEGSAKDQTTLFRALEIAGASTDICPYLTSFVYISFDVGNFHEPFLKMVRSRLRPSAGGARLAHVRVLDSQSGTLVRALRDEGLDAGILTRRDFFNLKGKGFFSSP
ncbi:hypothetical protein C8R47DRAFT_1315800 [Mycena vitilis]|nr:hypothetical protein C8R47DRAFT_1315800 [Mycena vitilis]